MTESMPFLIMCVPPRTANRTNDFYFSNYTDVPVEVHVHDIAAPWHKLLAEGYGYAKAHPEEN